MFPGIFVKKRHESLGALKVGQVFDSVENVIGLLRGEGAVNEFSEFVFDLPIGEGLDPVADHDLFAHPGFQPPEQR